MGRTDDSCLPHKWQELVVSPVSVFVFAQGCYFTLLLGAVQGGHTGCSPYCGAAEDAFCSSYWNTLAQALCSVHKASGVPVWSEPLHFPTNYPPALISKEEKWQSANIQLQKQNQLFHWLFSQAGYQVQDCVANWFSLHPQPSRCIPWGQSLQEEGWEAVSLLDSPAFSAVNQIGSREKCINDAWSATCLLDC